MVKRVGLFVFYDPDGIVDEYILFLLKDIQMELTRLIIIANGKLLNEGRKKLEQITSEIIVRNNIGYDTAAWKEGLLNYLGWGGGKRI